MDIVYVAASDWHVAELIKRMARGGIKHARLLKVWVGEFRRVTALVFLTLVEMFICSCK